MHISIYICTYITHVHNFRHKILIVSSMASTKTRHSRPGRGGKGKKDKQLDARHQCGRCFSWKLGVFLRTGEFTGIFKGGIYGYESKYKVWIKALDPHTIHTPRSIPWSIPHDTAWSIPLIHTPDPYPFLVEERLMLALMLLFILILLLVLVLLLPLLLPLFLLLPLLPPLPPRAAAAATSHLPPRSCCYCCRFCCCSCWSCSRCWCWFTSSVCFW